MRSLFDVLLGTERVQRERLSHVLLALVLMAAGVAAMHYFVWAGLAPHGPVLLWTVLSLGGMGCGYVLIRSGWTRRLADPSLTMPLMTYALLSGAAAYALVGAGRGGVFPIVMVILMFGMFIATPRQMLHVSVFAVTLFGATMACMAWTRPLVYAPEVELGHFIMVATMVPAMSILAARLSRWRLRARAQRVELTSALARIRELATRDELTGLINRRHGEELIEQEHQRCVRSGHTFCIATLEIDGYDALLARIGGDESDKMLRRLAQEGGRDVRVADVLMRWSHHRFVLLMSDTHASLARGGLDRLRAKVVASRVGGPALLVTLSAGLAEHRAGETVQQTMARAEQALLEARLHGADRLAVV